MILMNKRRRKNTYHSFIFLSNLSHFSVLFLSVLFFIQLLSRISSVEASDKSVSVPSSHHLAQSFLVEGVGTRQSFGTGEFRRLYFRKNIRLFCQQRINVPIKFRGFRRFIGELVHHLPLVHGAYCQCWLNSALQLLCCFLVVALLILAAFSFFFWLLFPSLLLWTPRPRRAPIVSWRSRPYYFTAILLLTIQLTYSFFSFTFFTLLATFMVLFS